MKTFFRIFDGLVIAFTACLYGIQCLHPTGMFFAGTVSVLLFLVIQVIPSPANFQYRRTRLRICAEGCDLLCSFLIAAAVSAAAQLVLAFRLLPDEPFSFGMSCVQSVLVLGTVFWNGMIRVYLTSVQLGLKMRVIGILCGWIPVVHLVVLIRILKTCYEEVAFENEKDQLNRARKNDQICRTKYPILLVHGVFFRDFKYLNYWGRIPKELTDNGAVIDYGNHQSALSVADSGEELTERIRQIVQERGCEKVNVIAHSKGGLDCRYAISCCGAGDMVASLTTINTPHHGCLFADCLLEKIPEHIKNRIAQAYQFTLKKLGDDNPDFLAAVYDLTNERCESFNQTVKDDPRVYYRSVGSKLNKATDGKFPLNFTYRIAQYFDGANDGLVSEESCVWGENFTFLTTQGNRGISHGDMIDLNHENIPGFDVREFYVQLINRLRINGF